MVSTMVARKVGIPIVVCDFFIQIECIFDEQGDDHAIFAGTYLFANCIANSKPFDGTNF